MDSNNPNRVQGQQHKIVVTGDLSWTTLFSETGKSNRKYPTVSIGEVTISKEKPGAKLELLCSQFSAAVEHRQKVLESIFRQPIAQAELNPVEVEENAIFVPSGGKDQKSLGTLVNEKPWWVQMAKKGLQVFLVVSEQDSQPYKNWLGSTKKVEYPNLRVISYKGLGIGCGRRACAALIQQTQKNCWMIDDRPKSVTFGDTSIIDTDSLTIASKECFDYAVKKRLSVVSAGKIDTWSRLRVLTFWPSFSAVFRLPIFCPSFILCKEDISAADFTNKIIENRPGDAKYTGLGHPLLEMDVDTNRGTQYENTNNTRFYDKASQLVDAPFLVDKFGERLTFEYMRDKYGFKNEMDVIKVTDAALHALLLDILELCTPKETSTPIETSMHPPIEKVKSLIGHCFGMR